MYFTPGNHDNARIFCESLFGEKLDTERMHISFRHKGIHFVCPDWGTEIDGAAPDTPQDLVDYLQETIKPEEPTILMLHYTPFLTKRWQKIYVPDNIHRFWDALEGRENIVAIFAGHLHQTYEEQINGRMVYDVASTCYQQLLVADGYDNMLHGAEAVRALLPLAYRVIELKDGKVNTSVCEVDLPLGSKYQKTTKDA